MKTLTGGVIGGLVSVLIFVFQAGQATNARDEYLKRVDTRTEQNSVEIKTTKEDVKAVREELTKHELDQARFEGKVDKIIEILEHDRRRGQ